jgi:hypothetical protein
MKRNLILPVILVATVCLGGAVPTLAAVGELPQAYLYRDADGISADQAAAIVRSSFGGRVVSVKAAGKNGWKVRVLLDGGRVKTVHVDASGSIRSSD